MKVLITGADGFVGSHLSRELRSVGHVVVGSDKDDCDLSYPYAAQDLIETHRPDHVVHLAARYGRILCRDEPHLSVSDNAAATTELAATCAKHDIPVLYASSSEVYGDHGTDPITEDSELRMPTTIYGLSKRWGEEALRLYLPPENLCIVRLNMLYGPDQRAGYGCCALAQFIRNKLDGVPYTVHRNTTRSWLYISDAVRAMRLLLDQSGVWNVGNAHDRRPMEKVAELVGGEYEITDPPESQIPHKNYVTKKVEALGWTPVMALEAGIEKTTENYRELALQR